MSRIDDLIQEFCPNGIPGQKLGNFILQQNDRAGFNNNFPVFGVSNTRGIVPTEELFTKSRASEDRSNYKVVKPNNFIYNPSRINIGSIARSLATTNILVSPMYIVFEVADSIEPKFFESYLKSTRFKSQVLSKVEVGARFRLPFERISEFKIQVPHIRVQREIVSILDKFTQLEAELEAELEARRTQYEVTRDRLLDFSGDLSAHPMRDMIRELCPEGVQRKQLRDCGTFRKGGSLQKKEMMEIGKPAIHYGQIHMNPVISLTLPPTKVSDEIFSSSRKADPGDLIIADTSEDLEGVATAVAWLGESQIAVSGHILVFSHNLEPKYVSYFFKTADFRNQKNRKSKGVKVKDISSERLGEAVIPVPPLAIQREIVSILDKLDALVNDIAYGLPAEIEARRKQYEYYRNKLLTFKELDAA